MMGQRGQVYCVVDADPVAERAPDLGKNGCLNFDGSLPAVWQAYPSNDELTERVLATVCWVT